MVYICNGTLLSLKKKKKEILTYIGMKWLNLENTILSKIRQTQRDKYYTSPPI